MTDRYAWYITHRSRHFHQFSPFVTSCAIYWLLDESVERKATAQSCLRRNPPRLLCGTITSSDCLTINHSICVRTHPSLIPSTDPAVAGASIDRSWGPRGPGRCVAYWWGVGLRRARALSGSIEQTLPLLLLCRSYPITA